MTDLSVVIPVYNSKAFLEQRLRALSEYLEKSGFDYEIIAVDDGSTDQSADTLKGLNISRLVRVILEQNRGKFGAITEGIARSRGRCCIFTDADIPYELSAIGHIVKLIIQQDFHLAIGDRTLPGSHYRGNLPPLRRAATTLFTFFVRVFVTGGLFDTQCGLKGFRGDVARAIFPLLKEKGFAGDVELLYIALKYNLSIRRFPARLQFQGGTTVHALRDAVRMVRAILQIRGRHRRGMYESRELTQIARQDYWNNGGSVA